MALLPCKNPTRQKLSITPLNELRRAGLAPNSPGGFNKPIEIYPNYSDLFLPWLPGIIISQSLVWPYHIIASAKEAEHLQAVILSFSAVVNLYTSLLQRWTGFRRHWAKRKKDRRKRRLTIDGGRLTGIELRCYPVFNKGNVPGSPAILLADLPVPLPTSYPATTLPCHLAICTCSQSIYLHTYIHTCNY